MSSITSLRKIGDTKRVDVATHDTWSCLEVPKLPDITSSKSPSHNTTFFSPRKNYHTRRCTYYRQNNICIASSSSYLSLFPGYTFTNHVSLFRYLLYSCTNMFTSDKGANVSFSIRESSRTKMKYKERNMYTLYTRIGECVCMHSMHACTYTWMQNKLLFVKSEHTKKKRNTSYPALSFD